MDVAAYMARLSDKERRILEYYAYVGGKHNMHRMTDEFLSLSKLSWKDMNVVDKFIRDGLMSKGWYNPAINPEYMAEVLAVMAAKHPADAKNMAQAAAEKGGKEIGAFYASVKAAVEGQVKPMESDDYLEDYNKIDKAVIASINKPWGRLLLDALPGEDRVSIIDKQIVTAECAGRLLTDEQKEIYFTTTLTDKDVVNSLSDLKAYYDYVSTGVLRLPATNTPSRPYQQLLRGVRSVNMGEYAAAINYFAAASKVLNRIQEVKNVFFDLFAQYYLVMAYAHVGTKTATTKLEQYQRKKDIDSYLGQELPLALASAFTSPEHMPEDYRLGRALRSTINGSPAINARALAMMATTYFGMGDMARKLAELKLDYPIVRHELSAYLKLPPEQKESLVKAYGDKPALTSIHKKEKWEWAIDDVISQIDDGASPSTGTQPQEKLIYLIGKSSKLLVPYVQKWLKSGRWGTPRVVSRKKFFEHDLPCMDALDASIAAAMAPESRGWYSYDLEYPNVNDLGVKLVGIDRVYLDDGHESPSELVTFDKAEPYLQVKKDGKSGNFMVTSNVTLDDLKDGASGDIVTRNSPTSFSIVSLTDKQKSIFKRLLSLGAFPESAQESVKLMLTRVEEIAEVRSPLIDAKAMPQIAGSTLIVARVAPASGMTYNVDFMAKPSPSGDVLVVPGEGRAVVYDMSDGKSVRVKRDIKGESAALTDLLEQVGDLAEASDGSNSMQLPVDNVLELIDYAQQNPDKLQMEWTQGKALSLNRTPAASSWNVGLKSKGDWFEVEGDVKLNEHSVVSMGTLLDLIANSKGRYVRLNDTDYLEISSRLRKQLSRLESITVKNRNKTVISPFNAALLDDKVLDGEVKFAFDSKLAAMRKKIATSMEQPVAVPKNLNAQLRPYQVDGFQWMARLAGWGAGACLADDMGLGKTVQTIAFMLLKAADGPAMVVAPASVVPNWESEIARFAPSLRVSVLNKASDRAELLKQAGPADVVLSTYGILNTELEHVTAKDWATVVLDEAHIIKNRETKMSAAVMQLKATNRIILTGTPIQNHLGELWNLFRFINPGLLGSFDSFRQRFVVPIQEGDKERQHALQRIIKPFMLRRTKADVIDDLPEKTDITVPVELSDQEMALYEAMRLQAAEAIKNDEKVSVSTLAEITKLRRAACSMRLIDKDWRGPGSKIQAFVDMVEEFKGTNNRMLVFSQFTSFLALVREALDKAGVPYLYLDGSTTMKERERLVNEFRTGTTPLFLISLKAGGLGLNLPEANYVAHLDPWWNPAIEQQATDRAYRIGQKRNVTVYHFISKNTIEEKIVRLHRTKRDLADSLLEGSDMAAKLTLADVMELVSTPTDN